MLLFFFVNLKTLAEKKVGTKKLIKLVGELSM